MSISAWSTTASQNGGRLVSGNYLEQQSPSTLNDAGRSVMSQIRSWANDLEWFEFGTGSNTTSYTRVSATSVSMPTNCVDQFHVNRRVKIKDGSGATVYGRVTSSAFNSPNTVLVFEFDSGSLGSGNPTSVAYGIVSATNTSLPSVVPTGTILMTGVATADSGYLICDGTAYSRTSYSALFTKIGTAFGNGDGSSTFNVPNLQSKFPMGKGSSDNIGDSNGSFTQTPTGTNSAQTFTGNAFTPSGSVSVAVNNHTLTTSQIPSHDIKYFLTIHQLVVFIEKMVVVLAQIPMRLIRILQISGLMILNIALLCGGHHQYTTLESRWLGIIMVRLARLVALLLHQLVL